MATSVLLDDILLSGEEDFAGDFCDWLAVCFGSALTKMLANLLPLAGVFDGLALEEDAGDFLLAVGDEEVGEFLLAVGEVVVVDFLLTVGDEELGDFLLFSGDRLFFIFSGDGDFVLSVSICSSSESLSITAAFFFFVRDLGGGLTGESFDESSSLTTGAAAASFSLADDFLLLLAGRMGESTVAAAATSVFNFFLLSACKGVGSGSDFRLNDFRAKKNNVNR